MTAELAREQDLRRLLASAILQTAVEDPHSTSHHASEMAIVAPIFARMYSLWERNTGIRVDLEYDREGESGAYKCSVDSLDEHASSSWKRPDVLVHQRGTDQHNLLVVEFKRSADDVKDVSKVHHLMGECKRYRYGATVVVNHEGQGPYWRWFNSPDIVPELEVVSLGSC